MIEAGFIEREPFRMRATEWRSGLGSELGSVELASRKLINQGKAGCWRHHLHGNTKVTKTRKQRR